MQITLSCQNNLELFAPMLAIIGETHFCVSTDVALFENVLTT